MEELRRAAKQRFRDIFSYYSTNPIIEKPNGFVSCCPIHGGDDLSHFSWRDDIGVWSCWSGDCGTGCDALEFVKKIENGIHFKKVLEKVEEILKLPSGSSPKSVPPPEYNKEDLYISIEDLEKLVGFIPATGMDWKNPTTRVEKYLFRERGIDYKTASIFHLGYAARKESRLYDRLLIPIPSCARRTGKFFVGVQARALDNEDKYRYLNFGAMPSGGFPASKILYNYYRVLGTRPLLITEGAFNAMKATQYGYRDVVAVLGSNLSQTQIELIGKGNKEVIIAFDYDKKDKFKSIEEKIKKVDEDMSIKFMEPEEGRDIADLSFHEFWEKIKNV